LGLQATILPQLSEDDPPCVADHPCTGECDEFRDLLRRALATPHGKRGNQRALMFLNREVKTPQYYRPMPRFQRIGPQSGLNGSKPPTWPSTHCVPGLDTEEKVARELLLTNWAPNPLKWECSEEDWALQFRFRQSDVSHQFICEQLAALKDRDQAKKVKSSLLKKYQPNTEIDMWNAVSCGGWGEHRVDTTKVGSATITEVITPTTGWMDNEYRGWRGGGRKWRATVVRVRVNPPGLVHDGEVITPEGTELEATIHVQGSVADYRLCPTGVAAEDRGYRKSGVFAWDTDVHGPAPDDLWFFD